MFGRLGLIERRILRRQVARSIRQGVLPTEADRVLSDPEAFEMLCADVYERRRSTRHVAVPNAPADAHPFLTWLITNLPAIISMILKLLPLFGIGLLMEDEEAAEGDPA